LLEGLNDVVGRRDLFERVDINEFPLPEEARSLARIPAGQLTQEQIERRNRLLLEAAYPEHIRKVYGPGWRPVMIVYGLARLLVAGLFWLGVRDRPGDHPRCKAAEKELIDHGRPAGTGSPHGRVGGLPLACLLRSRSLWLSSVSQFMTNFGWVFLITLLPRYLA